MNDSRILPVSAPRRGLLAAATIAVLITVSGPALAADPIKIGVIAESQALAGASILLTSN